MEQKYLIAPSILSADHGYLADQVLAAVEAGADWIHVDIMDGHFVPNMSMGPLALQACRRVTGVPLDVHLMVSNPETLLPIYAAAGADLLTVQVESSPNIHRVLQTIRELGCQAGLALNPGTPAILIKPLLHMVDMVLVMTVNPGFAGQSFLPECLPKIQQIRAWLDEINPTARIEVDGGIDPDTLPDVIKAGAQVLVAGSAIFGHPAGIAAGLQSFKQVIQAN
ncbi:MAG: ribulose-phosphate 3-epimerase [Anaerolineales bacterium]|nr:ribulose-phosphate 3-epimerase [Anaerolineales bacterium]